MKNTDQSDLPMEFTDSAHEALVSVWWTGMLMKKAFRKIFKSYLASEAELNLMMALRHPEAAVTQNDLSRMLLVDKSNVTGLIDRMENVGLLKRNKVEGDRRSYHITLTPQGRKLMDSVYELYMEKIAQIMSGLTRKQQTELSKLTREVRRGLADAVGSTSGKAAVKKK